MFSPPSKCPAFAGRVLVVIIVSRVVRITAATIAIIVTAIRERD